MGRWWCRGRPLPVGPTRCRPRPRCSRGSRQSRGLARALQAGGAALDPAPPAWRGAACWGPCSGPAAPRPRERPLRANAAPPTSPPPGLPPRGRILHQRCSWSCRRPVWRPRRGGWTCDGMDNDLVGMLQPVWRRARGGLYLFPRPRVGNVFGMYRCQLASFCMPLRLDSAAWQQTLIVVHIVQHSSTLYECLGLACVMPCATLLHASMLGRMCLLSLSWGLVWVGT